MELDVWGQQVVNGLTIGSVYAMIALGYTMVYGVLQMINFAHGEVFMFGAFAGYYTLSATGDAGLNADFAALAIIMALLAGMVTSVLLSVAVERVAYRPLRRAPRLAPLISAIGMSIFLQNVMLRRTNGKPQVYPRVFPEWDIEIFGVRITLIQIFLIGTSIVFMALLYYLVRRTRLGKSIRAVAEDQQTAALMGVNVDRTIAATFGIGAALAGIAGVLMGIYITQVRFDMGFVPGIKAFTAAVLGGIGNVPGAMFGGYVLGLTETLATQSLPSYFKDVISFGILVVILIFKPTGLFGEVLGRRA